MKISMFLEGSQPVGTLLATLIITIYSSVVYSERVSDKIYSVLQSTHYCGRRLNATHQMGCTSDLGGNLGIVWIVEDDNDLEHILKTGPTPPYVAVLGRDYYTRKNLLEFKANLDRVAGAVFLDNDSKSRSVSFSPEDVCPNRYSGLYANDSRYQDCKQNVWLKESQISGLLYDDIPYPIFLINDNKSTEDIQSCFRDHNMIEEKSDHGDAIDTTSKPKRKQDSYPLCGMQLDSFMMAARDAQLCLNSHSFIDELLQSNGPRCYPVDNHNIFAYYKTAQGPLHRNNGSNMLSPDVTEKESIVMLIAKLSSLSMFSEISPGADSTITSIVTLLAAAEALGKVRNSTKVESSKRNIAFALLDSEPFDYTGSSRLVYSMQENSFPNSYFISGKRNITENTNAMQNTNLSSIEYVINLDQMANYPGSESVYFHSDPDDSNNEKLDKIFKVMERVASSEKIKLERENPKLTLPPTPVHQFIKQGRTLKDKSKLVGLVLSNYGKTYNNLFYNSIYDDSHNINQTSKAKLVQHIAQVAKFVARSVYEITFDADNSDMITIDEEHVEQLLECYLIDAECRLFTKVWQAGQKLPAGPIQTYKDPTKRSDDMNGAITAHLLAYFIGDKFKEYNITKCYEENEKSLIFNFQYVNGQDEPVKDGVCIRSQVTMLSAQSPAFSYTEEGFSIDPKYPAWTVSLNGIRGPVRLYLKPSPTSQWSIFIIGMLITAMSIIAVLHIRATFRKVTAKQETQPGTLT